MPQNPNEARRVNKFLTRLIFAGTICVVLKGLGVPESACIPGLVAAAAVIGVIFIVDEFRRWPDA